MPVSVLDSDMCVCYIHCRNTQTGAANKMHSTVFQDEKARIETLGGCVTYMDCWRVNGTLAVSRAIGEILYRSESVNFGLNLIETHHLRLCLL